VALVRAVLRRQVPIGGANAEPMCNTRLDEKHRDCAEADRQKDEERRAWSGRCRRRVDAGRANC